MIFYYTFWLFVLILGMRWLHRRTSKYVSVIFLLQLLLLLALKDGQYFDFNQYRKFFQSADVSSIPAYPEPSYYYISIFFKSIGLDFYAMGLLYYGLAFLFIYLAIARCSQSPLCSLFIYLAMPIFFLSQYIAMRQALSIAIFLYATMLAVERKKSYVSWALLLSGALIHYSMLIPIFIFACLRKFLYIKFSPLVYSVLVLVSFCLAFSNTAIFQVAFGIFDFPIFARYENRVAGDSAVNILRSLVYIGVYFIVLWLFSWKKIVPTFEIVAFNLFSIGMCLTLLGSGLMDVNRLSNYFLIFIIILIPNFVTTRNSRLSQGFRRFTEAALVVVFVNYFYYGIYNNHEVFLNYKMLNF